MALIQIEEDIFKDLIDRAAYLRKLFVQVYEQLRSKGLEDWLTVEELCNVLNISPTKARSLKRHGRIGYIKCGKTLRFHAGDTFGLLEHIESNANGKNCQQQ